MLRRFWGEGRPTRAINITAISAAVAMSNNCPALKNCFQRHNCWFYAVRICLINRKGSGSGCWTFWNLILIHCQGQCSDTPVKRGRRFPWAASAVEQQLANTFLGLINDEFAFIHGNFRASFSIWLPSLEMYVIERCFSLSRTIRRALISRVWSLCGFCYTVSLQKRYMLSSPRTCGIWPGCSRAVVKLIEQGFPPDVAVVHGGEGYGLYLKTLLPKLRLISYRWYFRLKQVSICLRILI